MSIPLRIFETMSFVYPAFLFALSAIAIPIIVHLIQLRKYKRIYFSNVQFLHAVEEQKRKSNKLKNLLILFARILSILFLVFAFAQPFIPTSSSKVTTGKNYVSVYVDNSYSMDRQAKDGTLFNEAKRKAKEIALSFNADDEFQLLGNEFSGNQQRWMNRDLFLQNLGELSIRPESRSLEEIQNRQASILNEKKGNKVKSYIISDFQSSAFDRTKIQNQDSSIQWQYVFLESERTSNISIDSVWFYSPIHIPNSQEILLVKIRNYSNNAESSIPYDIVLNGKTIGVGNVTIPPESFVIDTFRYKNKETEWQEGSIRLKDQSLTFDNEYFFSYKVETSRKLALIQGSSATNFIEALYRTEPFFNIQKFNYLQVDYNYLKEADLIVLDQVDDFSSGLLIELEKAIKDGKVILNIPSTIAKQTINTFNDKFSLARYLPLMQQKEKVEKLNLNNDLFKGVFLQQNNTKIDLPNVSSYFPFENSKGSPEVLMTLQNGQSILNKYTIGSGIIYQFAIPIDIKYSDLPKHAIFVPLMLRAGTIHKRNEAIAYTIGKVDFISIPTVELTEKSRKEIKKDDFSIIPEFRTIQGLEKVYFSDQIKEAGIYELWIDNVIQAKIAFNANRLESDLYGLSPEELEDKSNANVKIWKPGTASLSSYIKDEAFGRRLWKICVILALFFIALEILIIRYGDVVLNRKSKN